MDNNINTQHLMTHALEGAHKSAEVLKKYWGKVEDIRHKSAIGDLVTEADKESEKVILEYIKNQFPTHEILSEESGLTSTANAAEFLWVIDPLDGTTNYTHQFPFVAVSVGLLYQGSPLLGVVYNPITNELFQAVKGQGAQLNGHPIHVSRTESLQDSLIATGFGYDRRANADNNYAEFLHIYQRCQGIRRAGAAALDLAFVAAGRLDAYWERGIKEWDIAAGIIIVQEAGGRVTNYESNPVNLSEGRILASNGIIHDEISRELMVVRAAREAGLK